MYTFFLLFFVIRSGDVLSKYGFSLSLHFISHYAVWFGDIQHQTRSCGTCYFRERYLLLYTVNASEPSDGGRGDFLSIRLSFPVLSMIN